MEQKESIYSTIIILHQQFIIEIKKLGGLYV